MTDGGKHTGMAARMELTLPNELGGIGILMDRLDRFAAEQDMAEEILNNVKICLDELVVNAISYAYEPGQPGSIKVSVVVGETAVMAEVSDDGVPFNPFENARPPDTEAELAEREIGGLGIFLVKSLMGNVEYCYRDNRNVIAMSHPKNR